MLSWFSFWLGLDAIPGRVTLLVTCMLTLVTMFTGADIPPVAYVKVSEKQHNMENQWTLIMSSKAASIKVIINPIFVLPSCVLGAWFMDGRLHGLRLCGSRWVCRCQSARRAISAAERICKTEKANNAAEATEHYGEGTSSDSCSVRWYEHEVTKGEPANDNANASRTGEHKFETYIERWMIWR